MTDRLEPGEVEAVLRRAAELEAEGDDDPSTVDLVAVTAAAHEVGISEGAVLAALAELRAGVLAPPEARGLDRLGPAAVMAVRELALPPARVSERASAFLRKQWFTPVRDQGGASVWRPRGGLLADLRREFDFANTLKLAGVSAVALTVQRVEPPDGRLATSRAQVVAQLGEHRRELALRLMVPWPVAGVTIGAVGALAGAPEVALYAVPASAALGGGGWALARRRYARRRGAVAEALEGMLDQLTP